MNVFKQLRFLVKIAQEIQNRAVPSDAVGVKILTLRLRQPLKKLKESLTDGDQIQVAVFGLQTSLGLQSWLSPFQYGIPKKEALP
jgi:hypothetical protein